VVHRTGLRGVRLEDLSRWTAAERVGTSDDRDREREDEARGSEGSHGARVADRTGVWIARGYASGVRIVVIGGRGFLGSRAVRALRVAGVETVVAGRSGDVVVDLARPETFGALAGASVVVDCSSSHEVSPMALASHVLAHGGVLLSASSDAGVIDALLRAHRGSAGPGALVLGAGIFTGVSNALARAAFDALPGCEELVLGVRTSPFSGAGAGTIDLMIDVLGAPTRTVVNGAITTGGSIARGPALPFVEGTYATLEVPFAEPIMLHASTRVPNVTMYMAPAPSLLRLAFLSLPASLLRMRWARALMRLQFLLLRRFVLAWLGARVGLVAIARAAEESRTLALTVNDGFALAGAAIAAAALALAARTPPPRGTFVVDELVSLDAMLSRARSLAPSLRIETRGFSIGDAR